MTILSLQASLPFEHFHVNRRMAMVMAGIMTNIIFILFIKLKWLDEMISVVTTTTLDVNGAAVSPLSAHWHFWSLIGLTRIVFLACASFLVRFTEAKFVSVLNSQKKRIKTLASIHCGRKNFSFLLQLLFYFGLTDTTHALSKSDFAWTSGDNLAYTEYCDVAGNKKPELSCICISGSTPVTNNGNPSVFICDEGSKCETELAYQLSGYCAQCGAGTFYGNVYAEGDSGFVSNTVCPTNDPGQCTCGITTYITASVFNKYYLEYVCSHNANADTAPGPENQVNYYVGQCSTCPAGSYSEQGDLVCSPCEPGTYAAEDGMAACKSCPPGEYNNFQGYTYCNVCSAGYYSNKGENNSGSTSCSECDPGYYASSHGSSTCEKCPAGSYTNSQFGATTCTPASIGYYVGETNSNSLPHLQQYECPIGSYTSTPGQAQCTSCPPNMSTNKTGSTSPSDCISCLYGVDPHTFACLSTPLGNNTCWDASQVLSMNASTAIENLYNRVYNLPDVGMNALISDAMSVIQGAAKETSTIEDIQTVLDKLKNAPENWLVGLSDDFDSCVASKANEMITEANQTQYQYYGTNLFQYQFGDNYAQNRTEWIAQWQCKGATFGCTSPDITGCPLSNTCFDPLYQYFASLLSFGGGTSFGNYQKLNTGRYTPEYSPSFIAGQLEDNVKSLIQWNNAATSFRRFYTLIDEIKDSEEFTANAIDAVLQVQSVRTSVSLNSSYTVGNLYYEQAVYNYNQTYQIAEIVQYGPAYCPDGYEITPEGIPPACTDYTTLVEECNKEIFWSGVLDLIKDTSKLAAGLVQPLKDGFRGWGAVYKSFNTISNLVSESQTLRKEPFIKGPWNPNTTMPPTPGILNTSNGSAFENQEYADASYQWYLDGQKNLSDSLIAWSPAKWDSIYLENEKQYGPVLLNPPSCKKKTEILTALNDYLLNVRNMSNYGSSMTAAEMSLVPVMGNIAAGIATEAAIINANEEISGMVHKPNPSIETAPSAYQNVYEKLFFSTYEDTSKAILAYGPSASLAQQQYIAAKSIHGFCTSYSYMNAGRDYVNTDGAENTANCEEFGDLYLPTYQTFNDTVNSFVNEPCPSDPDNCLSDAPSLVNELNENIVDFAANVQGNPEAVGQTRDEVGDDVETFILEFAYDPNATTPYYGKLTDGKIRFTLTPSSILLLESNNPFGVYDANPRVINVQAYWRGVTSPYNQFLETNINPVGPYMVYLDDSGEGTTFTLPPYSQPGTPPSTDSVYFARFESIQWQDNCGTGITPVDTFWKNGEQLQFCTPYSEDLKQPYNGIAEYAFLFPSMWTTWEVEAAEWTSGYYNINESELALQVMFQYVASSTASPKNPNDCAMSCEVGLPTRDTTPLPGQEWCDKNSCNDCPVSHSYNGTKLVTDPFCRCNVWSGTYGTCNPSNTTTNTFSIEFQSTNLRRRLKKKEKVSDKTKKIGKSAKVGKSEMMSDMIVGLEELLQTYLGECDGSTADSIFVGNALVQIGNKCTKRKKKVVCDFHFVIPAFKDETESAAKNKEQANLCIIATLRESDAIKEALKEYGICDATVSMYDDDSKKEMIMEWNSCSPFD